MQVFILDSNSFWLLENLKFLDANLLVNYKKAKFSIESFVPSLNWNLKFGCRFTLHYIFLKIAIVLCKHSSLTVTVLVIRKSEQSWRQYSCQPQKNQVRNKILRSYRDLIVWERKEGNHWSWHDCFWDISMKKKINNNSWCQILWMGRYYIDVVSDLFQSNDYKNVNGQNWERKKNLPSFEVSKEKKGSAMNIQMNINGAEQIFSVTK